MKGAEFHRNNFSGNHVVEGGECYLVQGVHTCQPSVIRTESPSFWRG